MKLTTYEILKDDTLQSIACTYNLKIEEMLNFHNSNSDLTQQIHSDYIPLHIKFVVIDPKNKILQNSVEQEENIQPKNFIYNFPVNARYKIEISTSLFYMGKPISDNKVESIWTVNYEEKNNTVLIEVLGKKYVKVDGQIKPLLEIVDKINKTTDVLHLQLEQDKTVKNVVNIEAVLDRWKKIKFEDLKIHELEDDYFKVIIKSFDIEFSFLSETLKKNILYQIFFYPQGRVQVPVKNSVKIKENLKIISQLFPQQEIYYNLWASSELKENKIEVLCSAKKPENWSIEILENEFKKNYSQLLKEVFNFGFTLDSKYEYDLDGVLNKAKTYIKEQASNELFYIGEYEITLLPDESNELK